MLTSKVSCDLGRRSTCCSLQPPSQLSIVSGRRRFFLLRSFRRSKSDRPAAAAVTAAAQLSAWLLDQAGSSYQLVGHMAAALLPVRQQAFVAHELQKIVKSRPGQEQHLFAGFSRLLLDSFPNDPVLFVTEQGPAAAAAAVLSSDQWAQMVERNLTQDPKASPGILQMLQAMPESSLPIIRAAGRQLYEAGTAAMSAAGHTSYLKLFLVATRPEAQGSGLGSAVLDAVVAAADRQGMPLYLEAAHDGLVPMYERYAFKSLGKLDTMTMMVRV